MADEIGVTGVRMIYRREVQVTFFDADGQRWADPVVDDWGHRQEHLSPYTWEQVEAINKARHHQWASWCCCSSDCRTGVFLVQCHACVQVAFCEHCVYLHRGLECTHCD